jgi:beta-glucosidase
VTATVTNIGTRAGADVVQLNAGQSQQVSFPLTPRDIAHWTGSWTTNAGQYRVYLGDSSRNVPLSAAPTVS